MIVGKLEPVSLREIWPNEARDFTTWLAENLDFLGDALQLELSLVEQEASAGSFSADILAEEDSGNLVIIENQLERSDHDHLGKLITYLSNLQAKAAVWITSHPRPEHEIAIHWLNETLPADVAFYHFHCLLPLRTRLRCVCCACEGGVDSLIPKHLWCAK